MSNDAHTPKHTLLTCGHSELLGEGCPVDNCRCSCHSEPAPRPWHYQEEADAYTHIIRDPSGSQIVVSTPNESTARLIVAAVNAHDTLTALVGEMKTALEDALEFMEKVEDKTLVGHEGCLWTPEIARAALAKAKEVGL